MDVNHEDQYSSNKANTTDVGEEELEGSSSSLVRVKEEEMDEDDDNNMEEEEEDEVVIRPAAIENVLSSTDSSEEDEEEEETVSEFEEDEEEPREGSEQKSKANKSNKRNTTSLALDQNGTSSFTHDDHDGKGLLGIAQPIAAAGPSPMKKKREAFTLQQKLEVLKYLQTHSVNATSRFYKVDPKSVRLWRSQKAIIEQTVQEELMTLKEMGDTEPLAQRKRIAGAGRKKKERVIVEITENPKKRLRRTIKLSDKVEIIRLIEHGRSQSDVARSLGISQSTVQTIWSNRKDILERNKNPRKKRKNVHWKRYSNIDEALSNWCRQAREGGVQLDNRMLLDKANEYAEYFKKPQFKQQAQRWLQVFIRKHNLDEQDPETAVNNGSQDNHNPHITAMSGSGYHQHQQHVAHSHQLPTTNNGGPSNHDMMPEFDLSSLPNFVTGLYNEQHPNNPNTTTSSHPNPNLIQIPITASHPLPLPSMSFSQPSLNLHLPTVPVLGNPVTTCEVMKYIELIRQWVTTTFGNSEEGLNNHLNAVENAALKRRMMELTGSSNNSRF